jgi:hypothetical protein
MIVKTDIYLDIDTLFINTLKPDETQNEIIDDICNDIVSYELRTFKCWEPYMTEIFIELLKKINNKHFINICSHIGYYSIIAAAYGFNVNSYEPNETFYKLLQMNTEKNKKITIHNTLINKNNVYNISKNNKIGIIKFNISGNEPDIIYGLKEFIYKNFIDCIITEISPKYRPIEEWTDLINFLSEKYDIYNIEYSNSRFLNVNTNHLSSLSKFNLDSIKDIQQTNILCIRKNLIIF